MRAKMIWNAVVFVKALCKWLNHQSTSREEAEVLMRSISYSWNFGIGIETLNSAGKSIGYETKTLIKPYAKKCEKVFRKIHQVI
jgi:hypothetical protein